MDTRGHKIFIPKNEMIASDRNNENLARSTSAKHGNFLTRKKRKEDGRT